MNTWKFTDKYPALAYSMLGMLAFSYHELDDNDNFTGTLDVKETGVALTILGKIVDMENISVTGTVIEKDKKLTVSLNSSETEEHFLRNIKKKLPLIGQQISAASLVIETEVKENVNPDNPEDPDNPDDDLCVDKIELQVTFNVGSCSVTISCQVPMSGGLVILHGAFTNVGIDLKNLDFLLNSSRNFFEWFPSSALKPYLSNPKFELLSTELMLYVVPEPFSISLVSVLAEVGITNIPIFDRKLYLNPLGVVVLVSSPLSNPSVIWALQGDIELRNPTGETDVTFKMEMNLSDYSINGELENKNNLPVKTMVQDLIGQDVGLPETLTIDKFDFKTKASKETGKITSFSTDVAMSGGFGLFKEFDLESFAISIEYSA